MIDDVIYNKSVSDDSLASAKTEDSELPTKEFSAGFPEEEKKWALTAMQATKRNLLHIYYVQHWAESKKTPPDIRVFHEVRNFETCKWEISNWGKPTSKLPAGATASSIETDLAKYKITRSTRGTEWRGNEWPSAQAALHMLTPEEIEKIAGVAIQRDDVDKRDNRKRKTAGFYDQASHTIVLYDKAMENCDAMALGTNPATMLPGSAGSIFHEVGHAIAYAPIRLAESKRQRAKDELQKKGRAMKDKWGERAFPWDDEHCSCKSTYYGAVSRDSLEQFKAEEKDIRKMHDDVKTLLGNIPKASRVVLDFQKVVRPNSARLPAVTPYAKEEMDLVEKKNRSSREYREAMEEFFAESFAVWKWYPKWLEKHRKAIHDFFAANKHLRSAAGPKRP